MPAIATLHTIDAYLVIKGSEDMASPPRGEPRSMPMKTNWFEREDGNEPTNEEYFRFLCDCADEAFGHGQWALDTRHLPLRCTSNADPAEYVYCVRRTTEV